MEDIIEYLITGLDEEDRPDIYEIRDLIDKELEYEIGCWEVEIHKHEKLIGREKYIKRTKAIHEIIDCQIRAWQDRQENPWELLMDYMDNVYKEKTNEKIANEWNDIFVLPENLIVIND
jgi:hypothetical protein